MTMNKSMAIALACGILGMPDWASAVDPTNVPASRPASAREWWHYSSLKDDPVPTELRWHLEGSYSRGESTGNDKSTSDSASARLVLRKYIVSSLSSFNYYKSEQTMSVGTTSSTYNDKESVHQAFIVDLTDELYFQSGARWSTDRTRYVDDRFNYYGGLQYRVVDKERCQLIFGLFAGYDDTTYRNDLIGLLVPDLAIDPYRDPAFFGTESFYWRVTDAVTLTEAGSYLSWFDNDGYYRWELSFGAEFQILAHLSAVASYAVSREFDSFVETAIPYGYEPTDTALTTGLKFHF